MGEILKICGYPMICTIMILICQQFHLIRSFASYFVFLVITLIVGLGFLIYAEIQYGNYKGFKKFIKEFFEDFQFPIFVMIFLLILLYFCW